MKTFSAEYVLVFGIYGYNANTVWFDDIQLNLDESGVCYTYDDEGNLITATDNAERNQSYTYSTAHEMTGATTVDNKHYSFTYSTANKHRLVKATSATDESSPTPRVEFLFDYDSFGNLSTTKVRDANGKYIRQYTEHTADGNYVSKVYSDMGYASQYQYDALKGTLGQVTDAKENSTYYGYDTNDDRILTVSDSSSPQSPDASTVQYAYNSRGYLSGLTTPSTAYALAYNDFGRLTAVTAGGVTLSTNTYEENNGNLLSTQYGNGYTLGHLYDDYDRLRGRKLNGALKFEWSYNADNRLGRYFDYVNHKSYTYTYDALGRPLRADVSDGSWIQRAYNVNDLPSLLRYYYNGMLRTVNYGYVSPDNLPGTTSFTSVGKVTNSYDTLSRLSQKAYKIGDNEAGVKAEYVYFNWTSQENRTTGWVRGIDYTYVSGLLDQPDLYYNYDKLRNITEERLWAPARDNPLREKYRYDAKNQLVRHDSATQNASYTWDYDRAGNITAWKRYAYTTGTLGAALETRNYVYGDASWGDLLTSYNGHAISCDAMGNMTSYNGMSYTWNGRELAGISGGGNTYSYKYNAYGIRTSKTVNGTTTEYFLNGSQILAQKTGDAVIWFFYDSEGHRVGILYNGVVYYYLYNVQGDVVAIVRSGTGQIVARYSYDAWGSCTVTNASGYTVGTKNPFRYRGYYFDTESGLYYLNSRYYSPEFGRFISSDVFISTGQGLLDANMFAYCGDNPINGADPTGRKKWYIDKDGNPQEDNTIKYSVPLYFQGTTNLCWAFSYFMRRSYESGKVLSEKDYPEVVSSWGLLYQFLYNHDMGLPFCFQGKKVKVESINDLFDLLLDEGPVYAAYKIPSTLQGHIVLVTGVDVDKNLVYTNNPWGVDGPQSFTEFCNGFLSGKHLEDSRFQLYGIYTEF